MTRVSVIIPTHNRDWCIMRAIESVLGQTFTDLDVWVIDDGGSDGTEEVVRKCAGIASVPVHYVRTKHRGVSAARNTGVHLSSGNLVALLDSDDEWLPDKLERQTACLDRFPEAALVHGGEIWVRNGIEVQVPDAYSKYGGEVYDRCLPVCMIGPSTAVIRREVLVELGGFDESFPVCEDYDLWLRLTSRWPVALVEGPVTRKHGGHQDQLSTSHHLLDEWRVRALCKIIPTFEPDDPRRLATLAHLRRRGAVLAHGYLKHGREKEQRELVRQIRAVAPEFEAGSSG